ADPEIDQAQVCEEDQEDQEDQEEGARERVELAVTVSAAAIPAAPRPRGRPRYVRAAVKGSYRYFPVGQKLRARPPATHAYSCMSPPSRSGDERRPGVAGGAESPLTRAGARSSSARCGHPRL